MKYSFIILSAFVCAIFSGCSREKAPNPPLQRLKLTIASIKQLEKGDHQRALNFLSRLHSTEKDDPQTAMLERNEMENLAIAEAQKYLDAGNIDGACKSIKTSMEKYGRSLRLKKADEYLTRIKLCNDALKKLNSASTSNELFAALNNMEALKKKCPQAAIFNDLIKQKKALAEKRNTAESRMAVFSLFSDYNALPDDEKNLKNVIAAQIEYESNKTSFHLPANLLEKSYLYLPEGTKTKFESK